VSGGVSELGGTKMVEEKTNWFKLAVLVGITFTFFLVLVTTLKVHEERETIDFSSDLNILKSNDVILFKNQINIINSLVLNELGESNCKITSRTQIDVNSFAVSLVCPIKEVKQ